MEKKLSYECTEPDTFIFKVEENFEKPPLEDVIGFKIHLMRKNTAKKEKKDAIMKIDKTQQFLCPGTYLMTHDESYMSEFRCIRDSLDALIKYFENKYEMR